MCTAFVVISLLSMTKRGTAFHPREREASQTADPEMGRRRRSFLPEILRRSVLPPRLPDATPPAARDSIQCMLPESPESTVVLSKRCVLAALVMDAMASSG
jgi:hypothetical protein